MEWYAAISATQQTAAGAAGDHSGPVTALLKAAVNYAACLGGT